MIRSAAKDDVTRLRALVLSLAHLYLKDKGSPLPGWFIQTLSEEKFEERMSSDGYLNWVYVLNGSIVGYISMTRSGHLYHLFVDEPHQGKGISRALWEQAARESGSNTYSVRSSICAVPAYKQFGFIEIGPVDEKDGLHFQPMGLELGGSVG